jgi:hypothetical protein
MGIRYFRANSDFFSDAFFNHSDGELDATLESASFTTLVMQG